MWYFAYGINMDPRHMQKLCPKALLLDRARLEGYRFLINTRGFATLKKDPKGIVHGVVWQVTGDHENLLNEYEGVAEGLYRKETLEVLRSEGGLKIQALIYMADEILVGVPEKEYLENVLFGARSAGPNGLPKEYLLELQSWMPTVAR